MVEFRSFQMFLILMIPFTAVTQHRISITVRTGDEVTLPCKDVKDYQDECLSTTWFFNYLTTGPTVTLFEYGKIHREAAANSDRLSVTEKCSLVIKKVTDEDVGHYTCRQFISGQKVTDAQIDLTVNKTTLTQHCSNITVRVGEEATLPCEDVKDYQDKCHSTTWIFNYLTTGPTVPLFEYGKIHREAAAKSDRLSVTEKCSLVIKKVTYEDVGLYICRLFISGQTVTDSWVYMSVVHRDNVATPPTTTTKLPTTTTKRTTKATTRPTTTDSAAAAETSLNAVRWIRLMFVLVGVAALSVIVVSVNIWSRTKGYKTHRGQKQNSDEDDDVVMYENAEDVSAPVRFHRSTNQL